MSRLLVADSQPHKYFLKTHRQACQAYAAQQAGLSSVSTKPIKHLMQQIPAREVKAFSPINEGYSLAALAKKRLKTKTHISRERALVSELHTTAANVHVYVRVCCPQHSSVIVGPFFPRKNTPHTTTTSDFLCAWLRMNADFSLTPLIESHKFLLYSCFSAYHVLRLVGEPPAFLPGTTPVVATITKTIIIGIESPSTTRQNQDRRHHQHNETARQPSERRHTHRLV